MICFTISSLTWLKISLGEILWRFLYHLPLNSFIAANTRTKISGTLFTCFEFSVTHSYLFKLKFSEMRESWGTTLVQLYENDLLKQLRTEYPLQSRWFYQFLQFCHALRAQFSSVEVSFSPTPALDRIVQPRSSKGLISVTYMVLLDTFCY